MKKLLFALCVPLFLRTLPANAEPPQGCSLCPEALRQLAAQFAANQSSSPGPRPAPNDVFGLSSRTAYVVSQYAWNPVGTSLNLTQGGGEYMHAQSGDPWRIFVAPVNLPTGALINTVDWYYFDNDSGNSVIVNFYTESCPQGSGCTYSAITGFTSTDVGGYGFLSSYLNHTVRNGNWWGAVAYNYFLVLWFTAATVNLQTGPMVIYYQRQLSPAPATATFSDVPISHPFFQHVEALVASGITGGCGGSNYCPNNAVTRGQMAVFLAKALGLHFSDD